MRKTNDDFVNEIKELFGDEYTFLEAYTNSKKKMKCKHNTCGHIWEVTPGDFLHCDTRCPECTKHKKLPKLTYDEVKHFVEIESGSGCILVSKEFDGSYQSVLEFQCKCGQHFQTRLSYFMFRKKRRCNACGILMSSKKRINKYAKVKKYIEATGCKLLSDDYINQDTPLKIQCQCGREFYRKFAKFKKQKPCCTYCSPQTNWNFEMIKEYIENNSNCILISKEYHTVHDKIELRCECGNIFKITFKQFQDGKFLCNDCTKRSLGERRVREFLVKEKIKYIDQYKTIDCKNERSLPFDFAVIVNDKVYTLIEYDGEQHYEPVKGWGGDKRLQYIKQNDQIKDQYCQDYNIPLIRIPYWEFDNIEKILTEKLNGVINVNNIREVSN
jgi:hypothetical protein